MHLLPGRDKAVREGHPWIFSGAVARALGPPEAPLARVLDVHGRLLGFGFWSPRSQIRVRMLAGSRDGAGSELFAGRLGEALRLRQAVVPADTSGYRLMNAEGDGLPGWTVDCFGTVLVSQITVAGLDAIREQAYAALAALLPEGVIVQMDDLPARNAEGLPAAAGRRELVRGPLPEEATFTESGLSFTADLTGGQKTGFYCDQRENRRLVERLARERSVLDLFAHSGAFGVYAWRGGARQITNVESAARSIERGHRHYAANGVDAAAVEWVKANVWEDLRERTASYDLVVCDPPPLARKRGDLEAAARAYKDLNRLAFGRLAAGGLLLTFSCSGAVDAKLFRQILFAAAVEAGVRVALLAQLGAAPDHPVAITHPQGEYLKGWLAMVQGR